MKKQINALVLQDATGQEIDFVKLSINENPQEGDYAEVDNDPANGEFVTPEGETWIFKSGKLVTIKEAEIIEDDILYNIKAMVPKELLPDLNRAIEAKEYGLIKAYAKSITSQDIDTPFREEEIRVDISKLRGKERAAAILKLGRE